MEKIIKFLQIFANANIYSGSSNAYRFIYIGDELNDNVSHEISKTMCINEANDITLFPIDDWEYEMLNTFDKCWLRIKPTDFDLEGLTAEEFLVKLLKEFFYPSKIEAIKVEVYPNKYHACAAEEYIFKTNSGVYFLSFQVHS